MTQKQILRKVLARLKPYRALIALSVLCALFSVIGSLYIPILVGRAVDAIIGPGAVDFAVIGRILLQIAVVAVVTCLLQWVFNICNNRITYRTVRDIRNDAIQQIEVLPLSYLDGQSSGSVVSRIVADVDAFADGLLMGFTQLFTGVVTIAGTLIFMLMLQPLIAVVVVVLTPVSMLAARFIASRSYQLFRRQSEIRGKQTALIDEMIKNQKVVTAFGRGDQVLADFDAVNEELTDVAGKAVFYSSLTNPVTRFVNSLVYMAVVLTGALTVIGGGMTVGNLTSFLSYATQYTRPFNDISGVVVELQNAIACAGRVFELIEAKPEPPEASDAKTLTEPAGEIRAEHVDFSYEADQPLIQDMNFAVKPGQQIAIVGPTGCGKTTLINLLMRFYDVNSGEIAIDGCDIRDLTRKSLRSNIGMVLQETWLFAGTIRENIRMGRPEASDAEVERAAAAVYADHFIRQLPDGYDTVIGEEGGSLSQGQKQLLCIARVMLAMPPMLILDEATSSIDTRTEVLVQQAFARLMEGRTSFVVAHRLSTIQNADRIFVMRDGNIIETGTHEELLDAKGFYYQLYQSQYAV